MHLNPMLKHILLKYIKLLLKDLGDKTAADIKEEILDLVIPEEEWSKWWSSVRGKLKKDVEIIYPASIKEVFTLNKKKVNHQDQLKSNIENEKSVGKIIESLYNFMRDFLSLMKDEELRRFVISRLLTILNDEIPVEEKLQLLFLLSDLKHDVTEDLSREVKGLKDINDIISSIKILSYKRRLLSTIREIRDDWTIIYTDLIWSNQKHLLRDFLYDEVITNNKNDPIMIKRVDDIIINPQESPNAFIWFYAKDYKKENTFL